MRVNGQAEYSSWGKAEWIPIISSFVGFGRLTHSLFCTIFSPKATENQPTTSLKGRVQFWSEEKRGAVALIPIFGNALIIWHDFRVTQELNKLENQLHKASESATEQIFSKFPKEVKNSKSTMLHLVKVNPEILKYSALKNDSAFMQQVAIQKIENLKYVPEDMMKDRNFILNVVKATDLDLFATLPELIDFFSNDPEVMLEMAKRNPKNLEHAKKLMEDENFVLKAAEEIYQDSYSSFAYNSSKNRRPSYCQELDILCYAPSLCQKADFMLKAKWKSYLNPIKYATPHFADNEEFILKMMVNYRTPGGWVSGSCMQGIQFGKLSQTLPLEKIASKDLKGNVEFIKRAIEIDNESWKFASEDVQNQIFTDRAFLSRNCGAFELMKEAVRRDKSFIDLASPSLLKDERFKKFVNESCPLSIYKQFYG